MGLGVFIFGMKTLGSCKGEQSCEGQNSYAFGEHHLVAVWKRNEGNISREKPEAMRAGTGIIQDGGDTSLNRDVCSGGQGNRKGSFVCFKSSMVRGCTHRT